MKETIDQIIYDKGSCFSISCNSCGLNTLCRIVTSQGTMTNERAYMFACKVRDNGYVIDDFLLFDILL